MPAEHITSDEKARIHQEAARIVDAYRNQRYFDELDVLKQLERARNTCGCRTCRQTYDFMAGQLFREYTILMDLEGEDAADQPSHQRYDHESRRQWR